MSFHVPERYRLRHHPELGTTTDDGDNGCFIVPSCVKGWTLVLICSDGMGWEHVSVHIEKLGRPNNQRIPTWEEMCHVKHLLWDAEDVVMQLHPRESEYVNMHPFTLHLWRPTDREIPTPPAITVGLPQSV